MTDVEVVDERRLWTSGVERAKTETSGVERTWCF